MLKNHVLNPQAAMPHYLTLLLCECPQAGGQERLIEGDLAGCNVTGALPAHAFG